MSNVALIRFACLAVFLLRSFNFCLLYMYLFIHFVLQKVIGPKKVKVVHTRLLSVRFPS